MIKYLFLVLLVIAGVLAWMSFGFTVSSVKAEPPFAAPSPHYYQNSSEPIQNIVVGAVYFVPKNKEKNKLVNWRKILEEHLGKLQDFHRIQFQNFSSIQFEIYSEPLIGLKENSAYDTDVTQYGNPAALVNISEEIDNSLLSARDDLFWRDFAGRKGYKVLYILYEGVGASGTKGKALLSRQFLTDPQYADLGSSFFSHEFYHTLGIPDAYGEDSHAYSADLMGLGRFLPLENAYLDRLTLKELGL